MSKIVLLCFRNRADKTVTPSDINTLSERLMPDNITANPPLVIERNGILIGVLNPNSSVHIRDTSVCVGHMIGPSPQWGEPLSPLPDGSYALFRSDDRTVELATDMVASRTIWYVQTESVFVASTSQRAIVFFLRSFKPNEAAFLWMLSSGSLGLGNSWDRRIKCLSPDSRLHLDRFSWKVTTEEGEADFHCTGQTEQQYETELREALEYSFAGLSLDYSKWALLLSGGVDSRAILLKLKDHQNLQCITWGLRSALTDKDGDAYIARQLAEYFGLPHRYFELDPPSESLEKVFDRFISAGDGRTAQISGYLDGFRVWKWLFEANILGVIRGDEVFGGSSVIGDTQARQRQGVWMLQDYGNLQTVGELLKEQFAGQLWPDRLKRKHGESLYTYNNRLYQEFQVPVEFAALTELKCSYVEVVTPFLSRRIVSLTRTMPDSLRTDKALFRKVVTSDSPKIPYAKRVAIPHLEDTLKTQEAVELISDALNSSYFRGLFSNNLVDHIIGKSRLETRAAITPGPSLRHVAKLLLPGRVKNLLRSNIVRPNLGYSALAFRTYLAGKANEMFSADASAWHTRAQS